MSRVLSPSALPYLQASPRPALLAALEACPGSAAALVFGSAIKGERSPRDLDVFVDLLPSLVARGPLRALPPALGPELEAYLAVARQFGDRLDLFLYVEGTVFRPSASGWVWAVDPRGDAIATKARAVGIPLADVATAVRAALTGEGV